MLLPGAGQRVGWAKSPAALAPRGQRRRAILPMREYRARAFAHPTPIAVCHSGLMRRSKDRCKVVWLKHHMSRETVAMAHRSRVGSDGIRAVFGSDLALVAATHSGSRPALIESGWKRIGSSSEGRHLKLKLVRRIKAGCSRPPLGLPKRGKNAKIVPVRSSFGESRLCLFSILELLSSPSQCLLRLFLVQLLYPCSQNCCVARKA